MKHWKSRVFLPLLLTTSCLVPMGCRPAAPKIVGSYTLKDATTSRAYTPQLECERAVNVLSSRETQRRIRVESWNDVIPGGFDGTIIYTFNHIQGNRNFDQRAKNFRLLTDKEKDVVRRWFNECSRVSKLRFVDLQDVQEGRVPGVKRFT